MIVELESHQVDKSSFPPQCPVYIYDDQVPACCIDQGTVSRVMLQYLPKVEMFFEVDTGTLRKMCKTENIRYRNGCPVYLKYENQNLDESGGGEEAVKGIVLGICDIPANGNANGNAAEMRECTQDTFWYSIQLCNNPAAGSILHEVSPTKVSYRTCEIVKKEEEEEGKDEADLLDDIQVLGVKIENDDRDERDLHVPETVSFLSADQKLRESVQSLATRGKEETGHTNPEDDSNSRASKRRSLNTNSTSIGNTSIAETGFCKESQSVGLSASITPKWMNDTDIPLNNNDKMKTRKRSFFSDRTEETEHNGIQRKNWRHVPPGSSDPHSKEYVGRKFYWCGRCNEGDGMWCSHSENEHHLKRSKRCDERDEHDDSHTNVKRRRSSNGTISADHSDASRQDFRQSLSKGSSVAFDGFIRNYHYQRSMFEHIYEKKGSMAFLVRDQTRSIPKSFVDNKTPMCIYYHINGSCRSTCDRAIDHTRTETPKDKLESFLRWCNKTCSDQAFSVDHSDASRQDFRQSLSKGSSVAVDGFIRNYHYQRSMFEHIYEKKGSMTFLVMDQTRSIPKSFVDNKTPMCIYYHINGSCRSTCDRAIDHTRTETPKDKLESFLRWCNKTCSNQAFYTTDPHQKQSSPNKIFTCKIRLAENKFNSAKEVLLGSRGGNHKNIEKLTKCKVAYKSGIITIKHYSFRCAESGAQHIRKKLQIFFNDSLSDIPIEYETI